MRNFGLVPVGDNPSTAQIIIPGAVTRHSVAPFGATQLLLPFKDDNSAKNESEYCNLCEHFLKIKKGYKTTFNTRCKADTTRPGGSERVIKLNVYEDEKVKKPFWCPLVKSAIEKPLNDGIKIGGRTVYPARVNSGYTERANFERNLREKWLSAPGLMSWNEIKIDSIYHLPPTFKKPRMTIVVKKKFASSIHAENVLTKDNVWLYKDDEEYKFMSLVK